MCKHLNCYIYMYIWARYSQYKPFKSIYEFHIYVYSLYLAVFMHSIICIYYFGRVARCYPTSPLPPNRDIFPQLYAE